MGKLGIVKSLSSFMDQLPVHLHSWTMFAHSVVDRRNFCQVFLPRATVSGKALFRLKEGEDLAQFLNLFLPFFSCGGCSFLSEAGLEIARDWFECVEIPQLFIEPSFRIEVDERVERGIEIEVNIQNEMINLYPRIRIRNLIYLNHTSAICSWTLTIWSLVSQLDSDSIFTTTSFI